jgi:hypothetical protein
MRTLQILHSLPFFANVPESLFDRVLEAGQLIMYTAGPLGLIRQTATLLSQHVPVQRSVEHPPLAPQHSRAALAKCAGWRCTGDVIWRPAPDEKDLQRSSKSFGRHSDAATRQASIASLKVGDCLLPCCAGRAAAYIRTHMRVAACWVAVPQNWVIVPLRKSAALLLTPSVKLSKLSCMMPGGRQQQGGQP